MDSPKGPEELTAGSVCQKCLEGRGEPVPEFYVKVRGEYVKIDGIRTLFCNNCGKSVASILRERPAYETQGMLLPSEEGERNEPSAQPTSSAESPAAPMPAPPIQKNGSERPFQPSPQPVAQAPWPPPVMRASVLPPASPEKKKGGLFGKLFGKKSQDAPEQAAPQPMPQPPPRPPPQPTNAPPPSASLPPPPPTHQESPPTIATGSLPPPPELKGDSADQKVRPKHDDDDYLPPVLPF